MTTTRYLSAIEHWAGAVPERCAFINTAGQRLSYGELWGRSDALCAWLLEHNVGKLPVALFGHKEPVLIVAMLACIKAGMTFVPLDVAFPKARVEGILGQLGGSICLCMEPAAEGFEGADLLVAPEELAAICEAAPADVPAYAKPAPDDPFYIIFTSGSTGKPKGAVICYRAIDCLLDNTRPFIPRDASGAELPAQVHFSRPPYSFDAGHVVNYTALPGGHTIFALEQEAEGSFAKTFAALHDSGLSLWLSTPSFLVLCLADPSFTPELLPNLKIAVMGGETLPVSAAAEFLRRFPGVTLINRYGPTETSIFVCRVPMTQEMVDCGKSLPIGYENPHAEIHIVDHETHEDVPYGTPGEICILGEQVGGGYYHEPEKTAAAFGTHKGRDGQMYSCYFSADKGWMEENGLVYFIERYDFQVKINGFRIECGEIEETLNGYPEVVQSCVLPVERNGTYTALTAHVLLASGVEGDRALTKELKERLKKTLPAYMIPRAFKYHDEFPYNVNGKIDRKAL